MFEFLKQMFKTPPPPVPKPFPRADIPDEGPFVVAHYDPAWGFIRIWEGHATRHDGMYITIWENGICRTEKIEPNQAVSDRSTISIDPRMVKKYIAALARAGQECGQVKMEGDWEC